MKYKKNNIFRALLILLTMLILSNGTIVNASGKKVKFTNNNGVKISELEYNNLLNLGFTEFEILNMNAKEFIANKDLNGEVVSKKIKYISDYDIGTLNSDGQVTTQYKRLKTTIISVSDRFRYKVTLEWLKFPTNRSYDIIAIGIDPNVRIYGDLQYFQQNICYTSSNCINNTEHNKYISNGGGGASFKLPSGTLTSLSSYLYFDVVKNTSSTINQLNAYGDYSHATKTVSSNDSTKFSVGTNGIYLNKSIANNYDSMTVAKAVWTGNW